MRCEYFEAGRCASCTLMATPYAAQLAAKDARVRRELAPFLRGDAGARTLGEHDAGPEPTRTRAREAGARTTGLNAAGAHEAAVRDDREHGAGPGPADSKPAGLSPAFPSPPPPGSRPARWLAPASSREAGFRNKAKLAVGGTVENPTLGILDADFAGVDLSECPLYEPALAAAFPALRTFVSLASLEPYRPAEDRGELKQILVTSAPSGALMVRFVLRSTEAVVRIKKHLPWLLEELAEASGCTGGEHVVSVNLLPQRAALTEGDEEILLTAREHLEMDLGAVTLLLRPGSFFQTNTAIAQALYAQARQWVDELMASSARPLRIWDLFCGAGGFALHLDGPGRQVLGVEISEEAVESARAGAAAVGSSARFVVGDAEASAYAHPKPDVVVVNPPRRGIGELAEWIEGSGASHVIYSSCNPESLAADLAAMPSYRLEAGRIFDMFPHTDHCEVVVSLSRTGM